MSPAQTPKPIQNQAVLAAEHSAENHPVPLRELALQNRQPAIAKGMDPNMPHDDHDAKSIGLRGGERSRMCPGRFCFCIPCPLPCDFCII